MQNIQVMRFLFWIERRCHRIDHTFDCAVCQRENPGPEIKTDISGSRHRNDCRKHMANPCKSHDPAISNPIDDQAEENDAQSLWINPRPLNRSDLCFRKVEAHPPFGYQE